MDQFQSDNQTWHFTVRGPKGSPFEGGVYHGRIQLPDNYPIGAPDFYFLTVLVVDWVDF